MWEALASELVLASKNEVSSGNFLTVRAAESGQRSGLSESRCHWHHCHSDGLGRCDLGVVSFVYPSYPPPSKSAQLSSKGYTSMVAPLVLHLVANIETFFFFWMLDLLAQAALVLGFHLTSNGFAQGVNLKCLKPVISAVPSQWPFVVIFWSRLAAARRTNYVTLWCRPSGCLSMAGPHPTPPPRSLERKSSPRGTFLGWVQQKLGQPYWK